jgi:hypothetical protein
MDIEISVDIIPQPVKKPKKLARDNKMPVAPAVGSIEKQKVPHW